MVSLLKYTNVHVYSIYLLWFESYENYDQV